MILNLSKPKEVLNKRGYIQAGRLRVLPTLARGGRGKPVEAG
jgi:hypothetical protein